MKGIRGGQGRIALIGIAAPGPIVVGGVRSLTDTEVAQSRILQVVHIYCFDISSYFLFDHETTAGFFLHENNVQVKSPSVIQM